MALLSVSQGYKTYSIHSHQMRSKAAQQGRNDIHFVIQDNELTYKDITIEIFLIYILANTNQISMS
jgi:hypothetical protein